MPIVTVQIVNGENEPEYSSESVQKLADELGSLFDSPPGSTWVKMAYLERRHYAENNSPPDASVQPTFVEILKRSLADQESMATEASLIASVIAATLKRPRENVHVIYLPAAEGRVAFGGELIRKEVS